MDSGEFSIQDAMRFAQSDAGKELFALLQQTQSDALNKAMAEASKGDMNRTMQAMQDVMKDPKVKGLLKQMGGYGNG